MLVIRTCEDPKWAVGDLRRARVLRTIVKLLQSPVSILEATSMHLGVFVDC